jgi:ABC-type spermidine/putrescine transport system permease subunit I
MVRFSGCPSGYIDFWRLQMSNDEKKFQLGNLGFKFFMVLVALAIVMSVPILVIGVYTFPHQVDYVPNATQATADQWVAFRQAQDAWRATLKDLAQSWVFTPIFVLMGSVIGYTLRKGDKGDKPSDAVKTPAETVET